MIQYTLVDNQTRGGITSFQRHTKINRGEFVSVEDINEKVNVYHVKEVINSIPLTMDNTVKDSIVLLVEEI